MLHEAHMFVELRIFKAHAIHKLRIDLLTFILPYAFVYGEPMQGHNKYC